MGGALRIAIKMHCMRNTFFSSKWTDFAPNKVRLKLYKDYFVYNLGPK